MPSKTPTVIDQRIAFIRDYQHRVLRGQTTISALCLEHEVSRKTGYKMVRRHEQNGWAGLVDQSRAPLPAEHWSEPDIIMLVLQTRLQFPRWGAKKIVAYLRHTEPSLPMPASSVAHDWIRRAQMIEHHRRSRHFPHPHERMHRDLNIVCKHPALNYRQQQPVFEGFDYEHNNLRPHDSLGQERPASLYTSSTRAYPKKLPPIEYPAHFDIRRVRSSGEIRWSGQWFFLSDALIGEHVGFETVSDDSAIIHFGPLDLGYYSGRDKKLYLDRNRPARKAEK